MILSSVKRELNLTPINENFAKMCNDKQQYTVYNYAKKKKNFEIEKKILMWTLYFEIFKSFLSKWSCPSHIFTSPSNL